jgi:isocitrate dehydrogenase
MEDSGLAETISIPYIQGDGVGEDIWSASREVLEEAVSQAYCGEKKISWIHLLAGERALAKMNSLLPEETLEVIRQHKIALKGPLTTPVGGGFRSINVALRQIFDLYVCLRPIRYFSGLPSPLKRPEVVNLIILRENTEDIYQGIEWPAGTKDAQKLLTFLKENMGVRISEDSGLGIKTISRSGTRRFVKWGIEYANRQKRKVVTVVHKGNIMKYTEGAFRTWAYEVAKEYGEILSFEKKDGKILFNDRIADNMFMQVMTRPGDYDVLLCPNLNGDYLSDACAALIGGLGVAPGANIGDEMAIFEPTHGSAPKHKGKDNANPTSFLLTSVMLFTYLGLSQAALLLEKAIEKTIQAGIMTYDLARQMEGVSPHSCSSFAREVQKRLGSE